MENNNAQKLNVREVEAKMKSKPEVYKFLTLEVGAYLPRYETVTIYFLKDLY